MPGVGPGIFCARKVDAMKRYNFTLKVHPTDSEHAIIEITVNGVSGQRLHNILSMATEDLVEGGLVVPPLDPQLPTATHDKGAVQIETPLADAKKEGTNYPVTVDRYVAPPKMKRRRLFAKKEKPVPKPAGFDDKEIKNI